MSSGKKYNDKWIKKNFKKGEKELKKVKGYIKKIKALDKKQGQSIADLLTQNEKQAGALKSQAASISDLTDTKLDQSIFQEQKKKQKAFNLSTTGTLTSLQDQLTLLQTAETGIGDVSGLSDYLETLSSNLTDVEGKAATKTALDDLKSQLEAADLKQGQTTSQIQEALDTAEGNLSTLTSQFAGLEDDLGTLETSLKEDYGSQISDLSDTFNINLETGLSGLSTDLTESLTKLFQEGDIELQEGLDLTSEQLAALQEALSGYKEDAATDLSNVKTALETQLGEQYGNLTAGLADLQSATDQQILDVYKTGEEAVQGLDEKFASQLQAQSTSLQDQIAESEASTEEKLGQLGSLMNYRMIGDSAGGIKMRRSKAYKSGAVNMGTGQLNRSMKLQTLNL